MNKNIIYKSLAGIAIAYCLILILAGPLVLKPLLIKQAPKYINGSLELESLWINPFTHSVHLKNLSIHNKENHSLAEVERIYINVDILPLILLSAQIQNLELEQLKLFSGQTSENTWLHLPQLSVIEIDAALLNKTINIESILLDSLSLKPSLYKDKTSNFESFQKEIEQLLIEQTDTQKPTKAAGDENSQDTPAQNQEEAETETQEAVQDWLLSINNFKLTNGNLQLNDYSLSSQTDAKTDTRKTLPVTTSVSNINLKAQSIHSDFREDIYLSISMETLGGEIEVAGNINPGNMTSGIDYSLADIQLGQLNPYVEHFSLASLNSGLLNSSGNLNTHKAKKLDATTEPQKQEESKKSETFIVNINNTTSLTKLALQHQHFKEPLLTCPLIDSGKLALDITSSGEMQQLTLDTLLIDQCQFNVVLLEDGSNNLALTKPAPQGNTDAHNDSKASAQETEQDGQKTKQNPLPINIDEIRLTQHSIQIKDLTQGEAVDISVSELNLLLSDLDDGKVDQSKIELTAKVNEHAPLSLTGTGNFINPDISANTSLQLTRLGLSSFSPYTLALSSRPIEKGVLSLNIKTKILDNQLNSINKISIEGIKMGKREDYQGSGNVPLALAIAVLRDSNGNLNFDIPIRGDLNNPEFNIHKQVIHSLSSIINKAALAPLNMVGGLVGGNNTEDRIIAFDQQSSDLDEKSKKQAKNIAEALLKNPELALKLDAVLSQDEAQTLNEQQKQDLLLARINIFKKELLNSKLSAEQVDITPADIENVKQKGGLEIEFFAR